MIVECQNCGAFVEADEIGLYEYNRTATHASGRFVFLRCQRCGAPILVNQDNTGNMVEGDVWGTPVRIFPSQDLHLSSSAPAPIRNAYDEGAASFRAHAYTAAAIMCRKTLEGICQSQGVNTQSLASSLRKMKDDGLIDGRLFEWSDTLRMAGNEAAHDVNATVSKEDAKDMLDFTNAIVEYLFAFREKFEEFKKRQGERTQQPH